MEFRVLNEGDIPEAKRLWKTAFGDPEPFLDLYFSEKALKGDSIGLFDKGKLTSALHLVPYTIDLRGRPVKTRYIAGAATYPEYRNKGLMARLLKEALRFLKEQGIAFTHLYPFLHAFYEKFGWATYTSMAYRELRGVKNGGFTFSRSADPADMLRLYRAYTKGLTGHIVRNEADFSYMFRELSCGGGGFAAAVKDGALAAYALYEPEDKKAVLAELVFDGEESMQALAAHIRETEKVRAVRCPLPVRSAGKADTVLPYGMARIADAGALLELLPIEEASFVIGVKDDFAPWNAGVYAAEYGRNGAVSVSRTDKKPQAVFDIRDFAKLAHGTADMDEIIRSGRAEVDGNKAGKVLGRAFPKQKTFVFETY
jgi:predicted acetyltransferase